MEVLITLELEQASFNKLQVSLVNGLKSHLPIGRHYARLWRSFSVLQTELLRFL